MRSVQPEHPPAWARGAPIVPIMIPAGLKYTREHVWVRADKGVVTLGITHHAQEKLGDVIFVDLPDIDRKVKVTEDIVKLETVDGTSDVSCPVSGTVIEVNEDLVQHPEKINVPIRRGLDPQAKGRHRRSFQAHGCDCLPGLSRLIDPRRLAMCGFHAP